MLPIAIDHERMLSCQFSKWSKISIVIRQRLGLGPDQPAGRKKKERFHRGGFLKLRVRGGLKVEIWPTRSNIEAPHPDVFQKNLAGEKCCGFKKKSQSNSYFSSKVLPPTERPDGLFARTILDSQITNSNF